MQAARKQGLYYASWVAIMAMPAISSASLTIGLSNGTSGNTIMATSGQQLNIVSTASGTDATAGITGIDIYLQVANGGVDNGYGTNPIVPLITNINLVPSSPAGVFTGSGTPSGYHLSTDGMLAEDSITANSGTVPVGTNSVLGVVTFNATNVAPGTYDVYFGNVGANESPSSPYYSYFGDISSDYYDASSALHFYSGASAPDSNGEPAYPAAVITVVSAVPEPSVALLGGAVCGAALLGRRRRLALR